MESYNEEFLNFHSYDRIKSLESIYYLKDNFYIRRDDFFNSRNFFNNPRVDSINPRNDAIMSKVYSFEPRDNILSKECLSDINSSYHDIVLNIFDKDFINGKNINFIDNKNESFDSVFHDIFFNDFDKDSNNGNNINFVDNKNEKEKNITKSQQNNLLINKENKINNSNPTTKETTSQNKPKKILGRKPKKQTDYQQNNSSHGIYTEDNILVKIQTHYLNFIISFLNCVFPHLNYNKKLYKLDKKFKINIKKSNLNESLNEKTIGEIISNKIGKKYKTIDDKINANKNICEEIKNNPILNKILSENYLVFFKKFYYNTDSYINLKDYGLNKDIIFTKDVKNFKHLLKKNEKRGSQYIMSIKEYAHRNYMPELVFMC